MFTLKEYIDRIQNVYKLGRSDAIDFLADMLDVTRATIYFRLKSEWYIRATRKKGDLIQIEAIQIKDRCTHKEPRHDRKMALIEDLAFNSKAGERK